MEQHKLILDLAPYMLSVSPLDCEALDLLFGFDFTCRGNHNQLMAEVLGVSPSMEPILEIPGSDGDQLRAVVDGGLGPGLPHAAGSASRPHERYQVRMGDYPGQLSVYVTARQYGSLSPDRTFVETLDRRPVVP
jgi:hypothetical protein